MLRETLAIRREMHTAVSKGFKYEAVEILVQLFVDHKFFHCQ